MVENVEHVPVVDLKAREKRVNRHVKRASGGVELALEHGLRVLHYESPH